jgi:hypothetical protein
MASVMAAAWRRQRRSEKPSQRKSAAKMWRREMKKVIGHQSMWIEENEENNEKIISEMSLSY